MDVFKDEVNEKNDESQAHSHLTIICDLAGVRLKKSLNKVIEYK